MSCGRTSPATRATIRLHPEVRMSGTIRVTDGTVEGGISRSSMVAGFLAAVRPIVEREAVPVTGQRQIVPAAQHRNELPQADGADEPAAPLDVDDLRREASAIAALIMADFANRMVDARRRAPRLSLINI